MLYLQKPIGGRFTAIPGCSWKVFDRAAPWFAAQGADRASSIHGLHWAAGCPGVGSFGRLPGKRFLDVLTLSCSQVLVFEFFFGPVFNLFLLFFRARAHIGKRRFSRGNRQKWTFSNSPFFRSISPFFRVSLPFSGCYPQSPLLQLLGEMYNLPNNPIWEKYTGVGRNGTSYMREK